MTNAPPPPSSKAGFTLVEAVVATAIVLVVVAASVALFLTLQRNWQAASLASRASRDASRTLQRIVYGHADDVGGIRETISNLAEYNDLGNGGWELVFDGTNRLNRILYVPASNQIVHANGFVYGDHIVAASATQDQDFCWIDLTVAHARGDRTYSSQMRTYVKFRNAE